MKVFTIITSFLLFIISFQVSGQNGYHFGIKAGPTIANQTWNNSERRVALTYHFTGFVETLDPEERGSLYAQLGLHNRGSSVGISNFRSRWNYNFKNIALELGARRILDQEMLGARPYYSVGIRGEYNVTNNLEEITQGFQEIIFNNPNLNNGSFTIEDPVFLNKFVYGISIGGGLQFYGSEFFNTAVELRVSPDIGFQYDRVVSANSSTQIRNVSVEISLVLRFLREVIYE